MRRGPILAAIAAAICLLVVGCGGSDELSKAAFVQQANAICKKARLEASKNLAKNGTKDFAPVIAGVLRTEVDEIGALDGPSADANQIEAIVDSAGEAADKAEASKNDIAKVESSTEKAEKQADKYGLKECLIS